jgi:hypothetical protein
LMYVDVSWNLPRYSLFTLVVYGMFLACIPLHKLYNCMDDLYFVTGFVLFIGTQRYSSPFGVYKYICTLVSWLYF